MNKIIASLLIWLILAHCNWAFSLSSNEIRNQSHAQTDSSRVDYILENFYQLYSQNFDSANHLVHWSYNISKDKGWQKRQGFSAMDLGVISYLSGEYEQALVYYMEALSIFDSLTHNEGIARVNNEMAVFYFKQDEIDQAYLCLERAESTGRLLDDKEVLGTTIHHKGTFLMRSNEYEKAKPFILEVVRIREKLKDSVGLGYVYNDLAEIARNEGRYQEGISYISKSTEIRKQINDFQGVAINHTNTGELYMAQKSYEKAIEAFQKSLEMAKEIGFSDLMRYIYEQLTKCFVEQGRYDVAFETQAKNHQLKDSLFALAKAKNIAELTTKYETEKKEQQIASQKVIIAEKTAINQRNIAIILGLVITLVLIVSVAWFMKNTLQKKQRLALQQKDLEYKELQISAVIDSQEKERRRFAADLHDGFGQLISILKLNVERIDQQSNQKARHSIYEKSISILNEMYVEIRNICFNLMPQSLMKYGLSPALQEFAEKVNATNKLFVEVLIYDLEERLTDLQEISIYRIVQEWVNNILKYGDASRITVQITRDQEELTLTIEDDGNGFELDLLTEGSGNGWKNIRSRVNLIKGDIEIDSTLGQKGNLFAINVPLKVQVEEVVA